MSNKSSVEQKQCQTKAVSNKSSVEQKQCRTEAIEMTRSRQRVWPRLMLMNFSDENVNNENEEDSLKMSQREKN